MSQMTTEGVAAAHTGRASRTRRSPPAARLTAVGPPHDPVGLAGVDGGEGAFHHEALLYHDEDGFLEGVASFVAEALAREEPVLVALGEKKIASLKRALGVAAQRVQFTDMRELGRNPARIIPAWRAFLEAHAPEGRPVRGVGEPAWPGRSPAELCECALHESLLNFAFAGGQAWRLLCPYDAGGLEPEVIRTAEHNHPLVSGEEHLRSESYRPIRERGEVLEGSLPAPAKQPQELAVGPGDLAQLRAAVSRWASDALLEPERSEQLVLAVSEAATNSIRYAGGRGLVRMWSEGEELICEVQDRGRIEDPLVGRVRPSPGRTSGRGLWLVNQLCDLVQIRSGPAGSLVRLHMHLAGSP
jgi:anti-sigma regulatory factor (Ser/Thr protein kinase)